MRPQHVMVNIAEGAKLRLIEEGKVGSVLKEEKKKSAGFSEHFWGAGCYVSL